MNFLRRYISVCLGFGLALIFSSCRKEPDHVDSFQFTSPYVRQNAVGSTSTLSQSLEASLKELNDTYREIVNEDNGRVFYSKLLGNSPQMKTISSFLNLAGNLQTRPNQWSQDDMVAFLINVYNAAVIDRVIAKANENGAHLPTQLFSIGDRKVFDHQVSVGFHNPKEIKLNDLRLEILKDSVLLTLPQRFFALIDGSVSGALARDEIYDGGRLRAQLEDQEKRLFESEGAFSWNQRSKKLVVPSIMDTEFQTALSSGKNIFVTFRAYLLQHLPETIRPGGLKNLKESELSLKTWDYNLNKQDE